jgi:hypothetical protein
MTLTPQLAADFDEYPELRALANAALRHVAGLMSIHSIAGLRRIHKKGVFDHPYDKDVTTPVDIPGVPETVIAGQHAVGKALLDYLAAIGFDGMQLGISKEDAQAMAALWAPPQAPGAEPGHGEDGLDPKPADTPADTSEQPETAHAGQQEKNAETATGKEK